MPEWNFIALLHNLPLRKAIANEYLAIVPGDDSRCVELIESSLPLGRIVGNFTDQFGRRVSPSLLLVRNGAPPSILKQDAIIGFRNILALSTIVFAWQETLVKKLSFNVFKYSNYFDIYPITLSNNGDELVIRSPSILGMDDPNEFIGQISPELARSSPLGDEYDKELLESMMALWDERFVDGKEKNWHTRVLFRSLEMAYHASAIPFENTSTIYDYGAKIALWISAFEVLVRTRTEQASLGKVLALLQEAKLYWPRLRHRRYVIKFGKNRGRGRLSEKIYHALYVARNDFLHGNPVQTHNLFVNKRIRYHPLTAAAPIIYKQALQAFLKIPRLPGVGDYPMGDYANIRNFEDGLNALSKESNRRSRKRKTKLSKIRG